MPFDSPDYDLAELLRDVATGKIQLPDFQREWKWDDPRIASLIASISLGYPIGVIMLLRIGEDGIRFAPKPISGVTDAITAELLLLDGQQRLTSLYQALYSDEPVDTVDPRGKKLKRFYYIDIAKTLDPNEDREDAIVSVPEDRVIRADFGRVVVADYSSIDKECQAEVFPLNRLFRHALFTSWQTRFLTANPARVTERAEQWTAFQTQVLENLDRYKLPAIILDRSTPKEAVCTVFEKVNTGGVPLNVFELLTAAFAADGFRLKDDWAARKDRLAESPVLRAVENTDFLQVVTLLATRARREAFVPTQSDSIAPGISAKRKDMLKLTPDEYRGWADRVTDAFCWAATFLAQERIFRAADIPYRTQLIPLAAIRVVLGTMADQHAAAAKLRQWFWCGVLGELYGGAIETRFARDLEQVVPWILDDGTTPTTVAEATFRAGRLLTLKTRLSAAYKGIHALLMRGGCIDWIYRQQIDLSSFFDFQIDIHHIFPKAWCERNGIASDRRESVVNKTPLSYITNRAIGGSSPAEYIGYVEDKSGVAGAELDRIIETHAIDAAALRSADFDSFFTSRTEALLRLIAEAMGKEPVRDDLADEETGAYEDEPDELEALPVSDALDSTLTQAQLFGLPRSPSAATTPS